MLDRYQIAMLVILALSMLISASMSTPKIGMLNAMQANVFVQMNFQGNRLVYAQLNHDLSTANMIEVCTSLEMRYRGDGCWER